MLHRSTFQHRLMNGKRRLTELKSQVQLCARSESGPGSESASERSTVSLSHRDPFPWKPLFMENKRTPGIKRHMFPTVFASHALPALSLEIEHEAPSIPRQRARPHHGVLARVLPIDLRLCQLRTACLRLWFLPAGTRAAVSGCVIRPAKELHMSARTRGLWGRLRVQESLAAPLLWLSSSSSGRHAACQEEGKRSATLPGGTRLPGPAFGWGADYSMAPNLLFLRGRVSGFLLGLQSPWLLWK